MPKTKPPTNCRNCGAPLHGSVCEYCGTAYGELEQMVLKVNTAMLSAEEIAETMRRIKSTQVGSVMLFDSSIEVVHMPTITRR